MAEKITYILGAGASIGAFPLVKGTEKHGGLGLADTLRSEGQRLKSLTIPDIHAEQTKIRIAECMLDTGTRAKAFGNVDSYAKYLYHTNQPFKLNDLKLALGYFFVRQQVCETYISQKQEHRYLNFITSLVTKDSKFPSHVKILNWNYDFLVGIAGMVYSPENLHFNAGQEKVPPFISYYPSPGLFNKGEALKFNDSNSLFYLNGIAGYYGEVEGRNDHGYYKNIILELLDGDINRKIQEVELINSFHQTYIKYHQLITFAWEGESKNSYYLGNRLEAVKSLAKGSTIIVVIGYSFPFYNREVDNMMFETIEPTLRKVYFQDPKINGQFLRKRYKLAEDYVTSNSGKSSLLSGYKIKGVDIEHITDTDQFYIPVEV